MPTMLTAAKRILTLAWPCVLIIAITSLFSLATSCKRTTSIAFDQVPPASMGGTETRGTISGRVDGPHRSQHIVLYALADGRWWVQPMAVSPLTAIGKDGTFQQQIHLGSQYAAVIMDEQKAPLPLMSKLPPLGNGIEAVAVVDANGSPAVPIAKAPESPTLRFSGIDWQVRTIPGDYGAKSNPYSPSNVFLDKAGALHMRITRNGNDWVCSELHSVRSLGYGDYRFNIQDLSHLEPAAMFSTFTRAEKTSDGDHREMDIHITQRGDPSNKNAEFIVQPYFVPANFYHFNLPAGPTALELQWSPNLARFSALRGHAPNAPVTDSWTFTTGVPVADDGQIYINFCNYGFAQIPLEHEAEVVVNRFEFYP